VQADVLEIREIDDVDVRIVDNLQETVDGNGVAKVECLKIWFPSIVMFSVNTPPVDAETALNALALSHRSSLEYGTISRSAHV
jgi:hypothetical protein